MVRVYGNNDDGGHAPYLKVPANTLVPLPESFLSRPAPQSRAAPEPRMGRCGDLS